MLNMNAHPGFSVFPFLLLYQSAIYRLVYFDHCHPVFSSGQWTSLLLFYQCSLSLIIVLTSRQG